MNCAEICTALRDVYGVYEEPTFQDHSKKNFCMTIKIETKIDFLFLISMVLFSNCSQNITNVNEPWNLGSNYANFPFGIGKHDC